MGGWQNTITQKTKLTPLVVAETLVVVQQFVNDFNQFLNFNFLKPVEMGHTLGSTSYYKVDDHTTEYGDIDLQIIAPDSNMSSYQVSKFYNDFIDAFIADAHPDYVDDSLPTHGHLIFKVGDEHIQVDMLWTTERLAHWDRWRKTPQHGIKGLVLGNLFSTLGEVINMSLQSAVLMKLKDGQPINFQRGRKEDDVIEVTRSIEYFGTDILEYVYCAVYGQIDGMIIDDELTRYPGLNTDDVQISDIVHCIKGLAKSFELNNLYGKHVLKDYSNKQELLDAYLDHYLDKADRAGRGAKLDKAETPAELAQVQQLRDKIKKGTALVLLAFREK